VIVLGFDTATSATAVALRGDDGLSAQQRDDPAPGDHPGHATRLLAMAAGLLTSNGLRWSDLDRIAVGVGPGAFTGLRVGIATARGLAQSLTLDLAGVSSLEALAEAALHQTPGEDASEHAGPRGAVLAVIDARRGEVFAAAYEHGAGAAPIALGEPRPEPPERLAAVLAEAGAGHGPTARRWLAVGDGAIRYRDRLEAAGAEVAPDTSALHRVDARVICAAGERARATRSYEEIVPDYRRLPDAEIALESAASGAGSQP
jgi:tRNA threonylcarbamoyladenosine biosynthesis protein TsaB